MPESPKALDHQTPHKPGRERLEFIHPPAVAPLYLKSLFDRRPGRVDADLAVGRIDGVIAEVRTPPALLDRYRAVCGFAASRHLPISFPHVLAAGLHLRMLLSPVFPVRLPGLVHTWHEIEQTQPIPADAVLRIESWIDGAEFSARGAEFCLHTVVEDGTNRWCEKTGFLARSKGTSARAAVPADRSSETTSPDYSTVTRLHAGADLGRRYARASGDYNPIHLYRLTARAFGFKAAIAHGMWSLARCAAALLAMDPAAARLHVAFRRPLLLPASATLDAATDGQARLFRLLADDRKSVLLDGRIETP